MNPVILRWLAAKAVEKEAIERRRELDKEVARLVPGKVEGTSSASIDGYKVSVDYRVTRKVDSDKLSFIWNNLSEKEQKLFRWKAELQMKEFREAAPAEWLNQIVTSKPGAATVTIEEETDGN